jgi:STAM-binding protein
MDLDWIDTPGSTKQSPPTAISQQRSLRNLSKRPLTMEELDTRARDDLWDGKETLGHYLAIAGRFRNDGNDLQARGDYESAYVQFAKAAALVLEKIPLHREYMNLPAEKRRNLATVWTLHDLFRAFSDQQPV